LTLPPGARVFVATEPVDGRKGIDGLSALVRARFLEDPLSGMMFVFFSRRADRVRVLHWDRDGYVLIMKRLERGKYKLPWRAEQGRVLIEAGRDRVARSTSARAMVTDFECERLTHFVRSIFIEAVESSFHGETRPAQRAEFRDER
jgi:transposase